MTLRQKMLLMLALTVMGVVAAVGWTGSVRVGHVFEGMDQQQTEMLVGQFQKEFNQRASDTAAAVDRMAASDTLRRIAFDLNNGGRQRAVSDGRGTAGARSIGSTIWSWSRTTAASFRRCSGRRDLATRSRRLPRRGSRRF